MTYLPSKTPCLRIGGEGGEKEKEDDPSKIIFRRRIRKEF